MLRRQSLEGKNALVTGGTRGIGAAIAARLVADGARVWVTGTASAPSRTEEGYSYLAIDFADRAATERFVGEVAGLGFDVLVNNAGTNKISPFAEVAAPDFDRIQEVNLRAPFLLCQAVLPQMQKRGWGRIVNISSVFGVISKEQRAAYSASKFGLEGMSTALAVEVASQGILVNCIAPGFIDTDLTRSILGDEGAHKLAECVPMRRLGKPEEVAALVAWLCGPENTFLTAQNIVIDGGFTRV